MNSHQIPETIAYDDGQLFRVRHIAQPDRPGRRPYEFVDRIGAVIVLPIVQIEDVPYVLAIMNTRAHYGVSFGLPGGHREGGFDMPEPVVAAGLRELREETGYGYADVPSNVDAFDLREVSGTINYPRSLVIARGVRDIGGKQANPREQVEPQLMPLEDYAGPLLDGVRTDLRSEVNLAFMRAGARLGREAVMEWLHLGAASPDAAAITESFEPWLRPTAG